MREKKTVDIVFLTGPLAGRTLDIEKDQIADGVLNQIVTHEGNPDDAQTIYRRIKPGTHTINRYDVFLDPKGKSFGYATLKESVFEHQPHDDVFKEQREEFNFTASDVLKQREEHRAEDGDFSHNANSLNFSFLTQTIEKIKDREEKAHKANVYQVNLSLNDAKKLGTGFLSVTIENGDVVFTHLDSESVEIKSEKK
ncbi:hypothetical protein HJ024_00610 [Vibrio parahaemolyticus]|uniref:hypothetical protein n=1 Tax=Vibrio parahaemolyticus TaxID=670 RepID=UPI00111EE189|nr:hypothetical protein [Vibrio parahaemolyticus]MBE4408873.1 hypothetical protein [Vibrio parahaemolyticus]MCC3789399.1 hypothetical protein [Vibrio parahaemolyticus]TOG14261.1 hypothetical protein CGJ08_01590 [Vibrio parahaemolyticus]